MKNKTIALFMPQKTSFYESLYFSIKKAFEKLNYSVCGGCELLNGEALEKFIVSYQPTVFFEMNRCKSEIKNFPKEIIHVCWVVDLWGRQLEDIKGSEFVYFFSTQWLKDYIPKHKCYVDWLPPASDPDQYFKIDNASKKYKLTFIGHISNPWTQDLLQRVIAKDDQNQNLLFLDILNQFEHKWAHQDQIWNNDEYINDVIEWLKENNIYENKFQFDKTLRYDIGCRIIRKGRREFFIDYLIKNFNIDSFAIFGGKNWKNWKKYSSFYKKELHGAQEMNEIYNKSNIIIHEGVGLHFRVFDAMLAGSAILLRKSEQDHKKGGISTFFDVEKDYIGIDVDKEYDPNYIKNLDINTITKNAREKVLRAHTWEKRVTKIIKDIENGFDR